MFRYTLGVDPLILIFRAICLTLAALAVLLIYTGVKLFLARTK